MSNTLKPADIAVRSLTNSQLAHYIEKGESARLPNPEPDRPSLTVTFKSIRSEAARRLRWPDVYEARS